MEERIKTSAYRSLLKSFGDWLATLGYAESTVYGMPRQLGEFLQWLERQGCRELADISATHASRFMEYFKDRPNQRRSGGLSIAHVNKQIESLQKLSTYLKATGKGCLTLGLRKLKADDLTSRAILSRSEIRQLYQATDKHLMGMRDRAMLGVYYGCGLRKSEGLSLEVSDVLFERRLLYVRKAKNGYERYVPISPKVMQDLESYVYDARPLLKDASKPGEALFISQRGQDLQGQSLVCRLKRLQAKTANPALQNRSFGLHALRHSIATHLLEAGMSIENIALFLGHRTLDSTQQYTHYLEH